MWKFPIWRASKILRPCCQFHSPEQHETKTSGFCAGLSEVIISYKFSIVIFVSNHWIAYHLKTDLLSYLFKYFSYEESVRLACRDTVRWSTTLQTLALISVLFMQRSIWKTFFIWRFEDLCFQSIFSSYFSQFYCITSREHIAVNMWNDAGMAWQCNYEGDLVHSGFQLKNSHSYSSKPTFWFTIYQYF